MDQLELMRQQLESMKRRLDTQNIINDKMLRRVMRSKASWLNNLVTVEIILLPLTYIFFAAFSARCGVSQWYAFIFLILGAIDTTLDFRTVRMPASMLSEATILDLKKYILRQKKERFIQICVLLPLSIIWIIAFVYALTVNFAPGSSDEFASIAIACGITGGSIGGILGVVLVILIYRKIQRTNDSLLTDLSDLEDGR